jgi:hypothetical protein
MQQKILFSQLTDSFSSRKLLPLLLLSRNNFFSGSNEQKTISISPNGNTEKASESSRVESPIASAQAKLAIWSFKRNALALHMETEPRGTAILSLLRL